MDKLYSYINQGEHQQQDFKFRVDDAKKIARTMAAFANTDGGRLLIGVKDNGKIVGINPEEEFHMIQGAAEMYCKPAISFTSQIFQEKHKLVLEIVIEAVENKPIRAIDEDGNFKSYVRFEDHTLLGNKILEGVWKREKNKTSVPEVFDTNEQLILSCIKEEGPITLSKLYRKINLKKAYIDKVLILLISWNIVSMQMSENGTFYKLSS
ncbi:MAG: ATP-binding protein [Brumimicrobium sp.]|nr:ATP-binding protein [Brumimicrobium sp.]